jgi:hypothetical protein
MVEIEHRALSCANEATTETREHALERFAQQHLSRIVDDVVVDIRGAMELWPTLVEICYFRKHHQKRV